ncbi:zinc transporter ZIP14-like [Tropilaelaps mercedesae]|uniref:Zinc transporter ZIP14-like n=1 Tax=Tropilaelaps mercedesae TaxID=418985 RepID=A0A1V9XCE3_9ACAR|nr:zinc transporter ZIP14-like [Tropilaelaps mercedesae]
MIEQSWLISCRWLLRSNPLLKAELSLQTVQDVTRRYLPNFRPSGRTVEDLEAILRSIGQLDRETITDAASSEGERCVIDNRLSGLCDRGGQCLPLSSLAGSFERHSDHGNHTVESLLTTLCPVLLFHSHACPISNRSQVATISRNKHNVDSDRESRLNSKPLIALGVVGSTSQADAPAPRGAVLPPSEDKVQLHKAKPEPFQVWLYGLLSVSVISACSLTGLAVVPLLTRQLFDTMMNVFQGLAVGSLCGSAVFHLIPQAFALTEHDIGYLWKSLVVFGGIYFFYLSERCMKLLAGLRKEEKTELQLNSVIVDEAGTLVDPHSHPRTHGHSHAHPPKDGSIASVAWLIIFGDGMHNFIDGLSLGAAFNNSILGGISISVAVICEEFPHELGDFAVLLGAGMSARQAVLYNFLSALTCFLGLAVGILVGDLTEGTPAIFAFAGGMFLYISLVGMMSEINESVERISGFTGQLRALLLQNVGILAGVATMFMMAKYAESIDFEGFALTEDDQAVLSESLAHINRNAKGMLGTGF